MDHRASAFYSATARFGIVSSCTPPGVLCIAVIALCERITASPLIQINHAKLLRRAQEGDAPASFRERFASKI
jgi:hypothetical protein